jgi:hypothetical protein
LSAFADDLFSIIKYYPMKLSSAISLSSARLLFVTLLFGLISFSSYAQFTTSGSSIYNTTAANNLVLGATSASEKLTVEGNMQFGATGSTSANYYLKVLAGASAVNGGNGRNLYLLGGSSNSAAGLAGGNIYVRPGIPTSPATVYGNLILADQGGYVGVGTATPAAQLDVVSAGILPLRLFRAGTSGQEVELARFNSPGGSSFFTVGNISAKNNGSNSTQSYLSIKPINTNGSGFAEGITVYAGGSVGLGTNLPEARLHVAGGTFVLDGGATHPIIYTGIGSIESNKYLLLVNAPGFASASGLKAGGVLISDTYSYGNPGKNDLIVKGNISIGTTDPKGYKLAVGGKAVAEEVVVKLQASWPDYVFSDGYKLTPLAEVEAYIRANNHLPEIPTHNEVKQNGLSLGEMNALLLKKVEELTLYMIELKKENEAIRKELKMR